MLTKKNTFIFIIIFSYLLSIPANATVFKPSQDSSFSAELSLELTPLEKRVFQPKYNSLKGNGLLGIGWSMLATSTISRCSTSKPHLSSNIDANQLDAFCLDGRIMEPLFSDRFFQVTLDSGEKLLVQKNGECDDSCIFIVSNGNSTHGEVRWYGFRDQNQANGGSYFPSNKPVVWSLSNIQLGNDKIDFDHKTNFITDTSLPYSAVSTRIDPETNVQTTTDIRFIYQTRKDNFVGSVDGHEMNMSNLLTEIQFIPRTHYTDNDASIYKRNVIQFYYELKEKVHEKLLTQVEHCEWKKSNNNKWQECQRNNLYWTYVTQDDSLDCERHWNIPHENYLVCDQQLHNYVTLSLIDNGSRYNLLHVQYQENPKDDLQSTQYKPLLSLSSIRSTPRFRTSEMNRSILSPMSSEQLSDVQENRWTFEWSEPRELKYGRTSGFNTRKATSFQFETPIELTTSWKNNDNRFGHMIEKTLYKNGRIQGEFSCSYALQNNFQPYITSRFKRINQWPRSCAQEKMFHINPSNFESQFIGTKTSGSQATCDLLRVEETDNNMSVYNGYLERNSCDLIYSLLNLNIAGPQANSTQVLFPPDVKNRKKDSKAETKIEK